MKMSEPCIKYCLLYKTHDNINEEINGYRRDRSGYSSFLWTLEF